VHFLQQRYDLVVGHASGANRTTCWRPNLHGLKYKRVRCFGEATISILSLFTVFSGSRCASDPNDAPSYVDAAPHAC
jgi:hypothetical protein